MADRTVGDRGLVTSAARPAQHLRRTPPHAILRSVVLWRRTVHHRPLALAYPSRRNRGLAVARAPSWDRGRATRTRGDCGARPLHRRDGGVIAGRTRPR